MLDVRNIWKSSFGGFKRKRDPYCIDGFFCQPRFGGAIVGIETLETRHLLSGIGSATLQMTLPGSAEGTYTYSYVGGDNSVRYPQPTTTIVKIGDFTGPGGLTFYLELYFQGTSPPEMNLGFLQGSGFVNGGQGTGNLSIQGNMYSGAFHFSEPSINADFDGSFAVPIGTDSGTASDLSAFFSTEPPAKLAPGDSGSAAFDVSNAGSPATGSVTASFQLIPTSGATNSGQSIDLGDTASATITNDVVAPDPVVVNFTIPT